MAIPCVVPQKSQGSPQLKLVSHSHIIQPDFVHLDDRYKCIVGYHVLTSPLQTMCGHRVCRECLEDLFKNGEPAACPVADESCQKLGRTDIFPDTSAEREIKNLPVFCPYKKVGCADAVPLRFLTKHTAECKFRLIECENRYLGCSETLPECTIKQHTEKCQYRPVSCVNCGQQLPAAKAQQHEERECPENIVQCTYGCGTSPLKRREITNHQAVCERKPRGCRFEPMGCFFRGSQKEIEDHERTEVSYHLELASVLTDSIDRQSKEAKRQIEDIAAERDRLQEKMEATIRENTKQKETIQKLENEIVDLKINIVSYAERLLSLEHRVEELPGRAQLQEHSRELCAMKKKTEELQVQVLNTQGRPNLERHGSLVNMVENLNRKLATHDRQVGIHDIRLAEMDLRFQILETASYDGTVVWKIRDYERRKREAVSGRTLSLYSQPFYTHKYGYKMCARVYLNGDGMGKTTHMSLFFVVMRGEYDSLLPWPFQQKVTLYLLDQSLDRRHLSDHFHPDPNSSSFRKPVTEMNIASGCPLFVSHSVLENPTNSYLKDDTVFIKINVETTNLRTFTL